DLDVAQFAELLPRKGDEPYSWPQYVSRSILLAGHDYFLIYDRLFNQKITRRFSWFVRKGESFPLLLQMRGLAGNPVLGPGATQFTEIETAFTHGRWYDGAGDSLMVVSPRADIVAEATAFGGHIRGTGFEDTVICAAETVSLPDL